LWARKNHWDYCTFTNTSILNNTVVLKTDAAGTILSDIRDSSARIYSYGEIIPKINIPLGNLALFYVRSGWTSEYYTDAWTDWKLINEPEQRMEYTLSLTANKIIVDYDIKSIVNIYCINNTQYQTLAMNLNTMYLTPLTDADANNELYSYLWSGLVDEAIVDFAKVDQDGEPLTTYATNATFVNNVVVLKNPLPDDNCIVIVKYVPRYFVYSGSGRYIQFKIELLSTGSTQLVSFLRTANKLDFLTSDGKYFDVHSINPIVDSVTINYHLDYQYELENIFPKFFRRL